MNTLPLRITRWTANRKAGVVRAIANGTLSFDEAFRRYGVTREEVLSWSDKLGNYGLNGLKVFQGGRYGRDERAQARSRSDQ